MKRFVLWLIRKYLRDSEVIECLLDRWPEKDQVKYHTRELGFLYRSGTIFQRRMVLEDIYQLTRFDREHYKLILDQVLARTVSSGLCSDHAADTLVNTLIVEARAADSFKSSYVKYNAYLTNVVKSHLVNPSTTDVQLIVGILKKRVE